MEYVSALPSLTGLLDPLTGGSFLMPYGWGRMNASLYKQTVDISDKAPYLDDMTKSMTITANANGTYFSFNNYDIATPGALQVLHDASIK